MKVPFQVRLAAEACIIHRPPASSSRIEGRVRRLHWPYALSGTPRPFQPPQMVWKAAPLPPSCGVGHGGVDLLVWGLWVGNSPPSFRLQSWCGRIRGPSRVGSPGGREASLMRQTIFCGSRFFSETLGCPFRCFAGPWRFLLGTIQC